MGIDAGDFDNDGDEDLFVTNWMSQMNVLYVNDGGGRLRGSAGGVGPRRTEPGEDRLRHRLVRLRQRRLARSARRSTAASPASRRRRGRGIRFPLRMAKQLYRNLGNGRFEDVSSRAGSGVQRRSTSAAAPPSATSTTTATSTWSIGNAAGPLQLLVNTVGNRQHWLGLRLVDADGTRDMLGARVAVMRDGGPTLWRRARSDGSYASANDPRVLVGLGGSPPDVTGVRVQWPDGKSEEFGPVPPDRWTTLKQGTGK